MAKKQNPSASFRKASSLSAAGTYSSPLGQMIMTSGMTNNGEVLTGLYFEGQKHFPSGLTVALEQDALSHSGETDNHVFDVTRKWLDEYFARHSPNFMPPITLESLPGATEFRLAVWRILLTIPYGETMTYGEIARTLQRQQDEAAPCLPRCPPHSYRDGYPIPTAMGTPLCLNGYPMLAVPRAVGGAVGHNPISIIIPCHRVVGQGGVLTGYAGGVERKRWLLERERTALDNSDNKR